MMISPYFECGLVEYKEKEENVFDDERGRHKTDEEVDEVALLKRQLKQKEHELKIAQRLSS